MSYAACSASFRIKVTSSLAASTVPPLFVAIAIFPPVVVTGPTDVTPQEIIEAGLPVVREDLLAPPCLVLGEIEKHDDDAI